MHRHWTRRFGALLFGLWFVLAGFDSGAADACAMQGMSATSSSHSMPMGTDADHGSDTGQQHSQHSQHSHHCSCCCSCCATSLLDVPVQQDFVGRAAKQTIAPVASSSEAREAWVDFVLPFPTAPPAGHLA